MQVVYTFGKSSSERLATCRHELQAVANEAIKLVDFSIIHGYRNQEQQDLIYSQGFSRAKFPTSKHNTNPSDAFDFMPYPVDWKDTRQFSYIAGIIMGIGLAKGIILRWGGDWSQNGKINDERFLDFGHIEFIRMLEK